MKTLSYKQPTIVAEIGCNHNGDFELAKELIRLAKLCDANYVKFQKRNPKETPFTTYSTGMQGFLPYSSLLGKRAIP